MLFQSKKHCVQKLYGFICCVFSKSTKDLFLWLGLCFSTLFSNKHIKRRFTSVFHTNRTVHFFQHFPWKVLLFFGNLLQITTRDSVLSVNSNVCLHLQWKKENFQFKNNSIVSKYSLFGCLFRVLLVRAFSTLHQ